MVERRFQCHIDISLGVKVGEGASGSNTGADKYSGEGFGGASATVDVVIAAVAVARWFFSLKVCVTLDL